MYSSFPPMQKKTKPKATRLDILNLLFHVSYFVFPIFIFDQCLLAMVSLFVYYTNIPIGYFPNGNHNLLSFHVAGEPAGTGREEVRDHPTMSQ